MLESFKTYITKYECINDLNPTININCTYINKSISSISNKLSFVTVIWKINGTVNIETDTHHRYYVGYSYNKVIPNFILTLTHGILIC